MGGGGGGGGERERERERAALSLSNQFNGPQKQVLGSRRRETDFFQFWFNRVVRSAISYALLRIHISSSVFFPYRVTRVLFG